MACDASFLKHYHTLVIHLGILYFKNEETLFHSVGPISRYSHFSSVLNYVMETLIFHYNYERPLNDQYVHTKALANSAQ